MNKNRNLFRTNIEEITLAIFIVLDLILLQGAIYLILNLETGVYSLGFPKLLSFLLSWFFLVILIFAMFCIILLEIQLSKKGAIKTLFKIFFGEISRDFKKMKQDIKKELRKK